MVITAPPPLVTPVATIVCPTANVSVPRNSADASAASLSSLIDWAGQWADAIGENGTNNPYNDRWDWFNANFDPSAASALQATCASGWRSSYIHWITTVGGCDLLTLTVSSSCWSGGGLTGTECITSTEYDVPPFPFTATEPCCSGCGFSAGDVQVYHWPITTTAPSITMLVNSEGFTL
jgi:hypothetical protein